MLFKNTAAAEVLDWSSLQWRVHN